MSTAEISSALSEANGILRRCEKSVSTPNEPFGALKRQMQAVTCAEQRRKYWSPEAVPYLEVKEAAEYGSAADHLHTTVSTIANGGNRPWHR